MSPEHPRLSGKEARSHLREAITEQSLREALDDTLEEVKTAREEVKGEIREHRKDRVLKEGAKIKQQQIQKEARRLKRIAAVVKKLEKGKIKKPKGMVYNPQRVIEGVPVKKDHFGKFFQTVFGEQPTPGITRAKQELHVIEKKLKKDKRKKKDSPEYQETKQLLTALQTVPRYSRRTLDKDYIEETVKRVKEGVYFDPPKGTSVIELQVPRREQEEEEPTVSEEEKIAEYFSTRPLLSLNRAQENINQVLEAYLREEASFEELEGALMDYSRAFYTVRRNEPEAYLKMKQNTKRVLDQIEEALPEGDVAEEDEEEAIRNIVESVGDINRRGERRASVEKAEKVREEFRKEKKENLLKTVRRWIILLAGLGLATTSEVMNQKAEEAPEQPTASDTQRGETAPQPDTSEDSDGEYVPDSEIFRGHEDEIPEPVRLDDVIDLEPVSDTDEVVRESVRREPLGDFVLPGSQGEAQIRREQDQEYQP